MKKKMLAAMTAILTCAAPLAPAASDYLLELDGIKGESSDAVHKDAIEIESFSWGASNPTASAGSGGGAGKVSFQDLLFTTKVSKASPQLLMACATGTPIRKATLFLRKTGGQQEAGEQTYLKYELENVKITSYAISGSSGASATGAVTAESLPADSIRISFTRLTISYVGGDGTVTSGSAELTLTPQ